MHLHSVVDHIRKRVRPVELDQRDLDACVCTLIDLLRGIERHQSAGVDLCGGVRDPVLNRLLVGERAAESVALESTGAHRFERSLHLADPSHDVMDAAGAKSCLRDLESIAPFAKDVLGRNADLVEADLAMCRPAAPAMT